MQQKGTKKCKMFGNCTNYTTAEKCSTACSFYNPKNPNEIVEMPDEIKDGERPDIILGLSDLNKFDKNHEFFVAKHHVFQIQSVSPKKIILKYKRRLKETDSLQDGCYTFKNSKGDLLDPFKVFTEFDRMAK